MTKIKLEVTGLTTELEAFAKTLKPAQVESVMNLESNDERVSYIDILATMAGDITTLASVEEFAYNAEEAEEEDYPIFSLGKKGNITAGMVLKGRLIGTVPMRSDAPKENWREEVIGS